MNDKPAENKIINDKSALIDREALVSAIGEIISDRPSRIIISNRRASGQEYEKIVISPKLIKNDIIYQAEQFTKTQVFHRNISIDEIIPYITELISDSFRQINAFTIKHDYDIKISKKGKVFINKKKKNGAAQRLIDKSKPHTGSNPDRYKHSNIINSGMNDTIGLNFTSGIYSHDRRKKRLIEEGTVVEPLIDMGIFTEEGRIVKSMGDKFRQINRFLEIVDDVVEACGFDELNIVDFGCGKAYLTFILYYYLTYVKGITANMVGLDLKADVISKCTASAEKYGYDRLKFKVGDISNYNANVPVDMIITLHACDTATDYALFNAISWNTRVILSVPCCQHEFNADAKSDELSALTKYGIIKERFSALATDAIRASLLEYKGYKTQVLEFVDLSHTPKNLLIRAVKTNVSEEKRRRSLKEAEALINDFHAQQTLYKLIMNGTDLQEKI